MFVLDVYILGMFCSSFSFFTYTYVHVFGYLKQFPTKLNIVAQNKILTNDINLMY